MRILRIRKRKREREKDSGGSCERREIGYFNFDSNAGKPLLPEKRFCFILCCPIRMNEIDGSMGGGGLQKASFKRFEVITFRFMQVKEFREQPRTSFRLEKIPRFLSGNGECIVMRGEYSAEIANYTKWSTNLNDIRNFFEIKERESIWYRRSIFLF